MAKTIFISHRSEYAQQVRDLKKAINATSGGKIKAFISEDLPLGSHWRSRLEASLDQSQYLFLLYGAPDEDWSWCFYEAGYFAARNPEGIYCIRRPDIPPPGPLEHIQSIVDTDDLVKALQRIYETNELDFDAAELHEKFEKLGQRIFRQLQVYYGYERLYFSAPSGSFDSTARIPDDAVVKGDANLLRELFGIQRQEITWKELNEGSGPFRSDNDRFFYRKWLDETAEVIGAARHNRFRPPQSILIARSGGKRCRFLLYQARVHGNDTFRCEFLVIDDVGGPALGLSSELLALLTSIRMGFRFRYDFIERLESLPLHGATSEERKRVAGEVHSALSDMQAEALRRGYLDPATLRNAFEEPERTRIGKLLGYWQTLRLELYASAGLSNEGVVISSDGLLGEKLGRFLRVLESIKLLNSEFLSSCCARLSKRMFLTPEELKDTRLQLDLRIKALLAPEGDQPPPASLGAA
jgi:hypothetical protein